MRRLTRLSSFLLLLALAVAGSARPRQNANRNGPSKPSSTRQTGRPAIEFGHEGGNLRPYRVAIYADGRVANLEGVAPLKGSLIPPEKVKELVRKATDNRFWKSGPSKKRPDLPDFGFVFVKVRTASGRIIYHKGAEVGPLAEYYSLLTDLVCQKP